MTKPTVSAGLVTVTVEILNGKLHFCAVNSNGTMTYLSIFRPFIQNALFTG